MLWVEVSNRGLGWLDPQGVEADLPEVFGGARLDARGHRVLAGDLDLLRGCYAAGRAGQAFEGESVRQWLDAVTLELVARGRTAGFELPALRARRRAAVLPPVLDEILSTALIELLASPQALGAVTRCRGLVRSEAAVAIFEPAAEAAFAAEAGLTDFLGRGWSQCPRLVHSPRVAHYCGKACSNASFAARKGARDPGYFAAKQAQYRDRQRRRDGSRSDSGAFSFVD